MHNGEKDFEAIESEKLRIIIQSVKKDPTQVPKTLYNSEIENSQAPFLSNTIF